MAIYHTQTRRYVCDRCGDDAERSGTEQAPLGWEDVTRTLLLSSTDRKMLVCRSCAGWLQKFFEGRKVEE